MIIKVCGMRDAENIRALECADVDFIGMIFYPYSARYVSEIPAFLLEKAKRVGVFVDEKAEIVLARIDEYKLDFIQLHGNESPEYCDELGKIGVKIIKAFSVTSDDFPMENIRRYEGKCSYFLFDTPTKGYGGSGRKFNWNVLAQYNGDTPFLLSGGISAEDIDSVLSFSHPKFAGIDLNSRFEVAPAQKNIPMLHSFIEKIRKHEQNR